MSLGRPDLYIAGRKMQTLRTDPRPALAGLSLKWGTDNAVDISPASTLAGQLLIRGAMPEYLNPGAEVGLIDPATSRCLFAGKLQPLQAVRDPAIASAMRISFTAASPVGELEKHNMIDLNWTNPAAGYETSAARLGRLRAAMPRGWTLDGAAGIEWLMQGDQRHQSVPLLDLLERYVRGNLQRYADTSTYIPGSGLRRRLTITAERPGTVQLTTVAPGDEGRWIEGSTISGTAVLPGSAVTDEIEWEKTPDDLVTGVQVSTWGKWLTTTQQDDDSSEHEYPLDYVVDTSDLRAQYGQSTIRVETMLSPQYTEATREAVKKIVQQWINTDTAWRPTSLQLPDSRRLATAPLLNLIAVDTRPTAALSVPAEGLPATVRAFVLAGEAVWDGRKWITTLTLGRTQ